MSGAVKGGGVPLKHRAAMGQNGLGHQEVLQQTELRLTSKQTEFMKEGSDP